MWDVEHRYKQVQVAVRVVQGKAFNRDDLAIVCTCVLGAFRKPNWSPVYLALDLSLIFSCPAQTRLEESTVQTANWYSENFQQWGLPPLKLELQEQIYILSVSFWPFFLCLKPWESDAACTLSYMGNGKKQWIAVSQIFGEALWIQAHTLVL